jgi:hypothetical protein
VQIDTMAAVDADKQPQPEKHGCACPMPHPQSISDNTTSLLSCAYVKSRVSNKSNRIKSGWGMLRLSCGFGRNKSGRLRVVVPQSVSSSQLERRSP